MEKTVVASRISEIVNSQSDEELKEVGFGVRRIEPQPMASKAAEIVNLEEDEISFQPQLDFNQYAKNKKTNPTSTIR